MKNRWFIRGGLHCGIGILIVLVTWISTIMITNAIDFDPAPEVTERICNALISASFFITLGFVGYGGACLKIDYPKIKQSKRNLIVENAPSTRTKERISSKNPRRLFYVLVPLILLVSLYLKTFFIIDYSHPYLRNIGQVDQVESLLELFFSYENRHGQLPKCNENSHSWRAKLEDSRTNPVEIKYRFDEPWNSEHNLKTAIENAKSIESFGHILQTTPATTQAEVLSIRS